MSSPRELLSTVICAFQTTKFINFFDMAYTSKNVFLPYNRYPRWTGSAWPSPAGYRPSRFLTGYFINSSKYTSLKFWHSLDIASRIVVSKFQSKFVFGFKIMTFLVKPDLSFFYIFDYTSRITWYFQNLTIPYERASEDLTESV